MATPLSPRVVFWSRFGCWSLLGLLIVIPSLCWWLVVLGPRELTEPDVLSFARRRDTPLPLYVPPPSPAPPLRHPPVDSHPDGYEWVHGHQQGSRWVDGYWRRKPGYVVPLPPPTTKPSPVAQ